MTFSKKTGWCSQTIIAHRGNIGNAVALFFIVLSVNWVLMLFTHSFARPFMSDSYVVIIARSYEVIEYRSGDPQNHSHIIYKLDRAGDALITAVAYDPIKKSIAVAVKNKEPKKGTAKITILDEHTFLPSAEIMTNRDSIDGMSFDQHGRLAFVSNNIAHDLPGELSYLDSPDGSVHTLAEGRHFFKPSWGEDSKKIYFAYLLDSKRGIAYVELDQPNVVRQIANGTAVSVSGNGIVACLTDKGEIVFIQGTEQQRTAIKLPSKYTDPKFTDSIWFVNGTDDLILQHYKKSVVYDLMVIRPPYADVTSLLSNIGMRDYDAVRR